MIYVLARGHPWLAALTFAETGNGPGACRFPGCGRMSHWQSAR